MPVFFFELAARFTLGRSAPSMSLKFCRLPANTGCSASAAHISRMKADVSGAVVAARGFIRSGFDGKTNTLLLQGCKVLVPDEKVVLHRLTAKHPLAVKAG